MQTTQPTPNQLEEAARLRAWMIQIARAVKFRAEHRLGMFRWVNEVFLPDDPIDLAGLIAKRDAAVEVLDGLAEHARTSGERCPISVGAWNLLVGYDEYGVWMDLKDQGLLEPPANQYNPEGTGHDD